MKRVRLAVMGLLAFLSASPLLIGFASEAEKDAGRKANDDRTADKTAIEASIRDLIHTVDPPQMREHLFYLAKDPLPYRKLNFTLPGHQKNTLYEADDYLAGKLESWGYHVEREGVQVQAFRRDSSKPKQAQYSRPMPVFNMDSLGGKPREQRAAGKMTNVTAYTAPEGQRLAELMSDVNLRYAVGLEQRAVKLQHPSNDDGSFVRAGYPAAVLNIGSWPYGDPNYHAEGDRPELCDIANAAKAVQATLAAILTLDQEP